MNNQELPTAAVLRSVTNASQERALLRRTGLAELLIAAARDQQDSIQFHMKTLNEAETETFIELLECKGYSLTWFANGDPDTVTISW